MQNKTYRIFFYIIFQVLILVGVYSQVLAQVNLSTKSKKAIAYYVEADNYRVRRQYGEAINLLEQAIKKDDQFIEAYFRLASIYHSVENLSLAEEFFQKTIDLAGDDRKFTNAYLFIADVQITLEKYGQAKQYLEKYLNVSPKNQQKKSRAELLLQKANYSVIHISDQLSFNPTSLNSSVNQFALQYFPIVTADQKSLLFTKRDGNTAYDDEDIMISHKGENDDWQEPQSISTNINTDLNEGTCAISADGRTLVFTSCQGREGFGSCDLFISYKVGGKWSIPENMGSVINSSSWDSQPALSADGRKLYFVSNRNGGLGGRDVWVSNRNKEQWTAPINLGKGINTSHEEISPFIHPNGRTLYFASDGLPGFGGFDIYQNELDSLKKWGESRNIGYPINRGTNQMSLIITADGTKGYYSDSGGSQQKLSEIKQFDVPDQIGLKYRSRYVKGTVRDEKSQIPIKCQIELYDLSSHELVGEVTSDSITGEYLMVLTEGVNYALYIEKKGYVFKSINFDFKQGDLESLIVDVDLTPISKGAIAILNNIFFEHDSYSLNEESRLELDKVALFIKRNNVSLEIGGYTDGSGTATYNLSLSQKRAKAVYDYLINDNNTPQNVLSYRGYGQDKNVELEQSKLARRIEFKLL